MNKKNTDITPPLKWAGGKRKMSGIITKAAASLGGPFTFYEPFFGGGAIFFSLYSQGYIQDAYLNDIVPQIANFYRTVADDNSIEEVITQTQFYESKFNNLVQNPELRKTEYIELRQEFNKEWIDNKKKIFDSDIPTEENIGLASKFLALNKLGFNGMFRLNSKDEFNIPMGSSTNKQLIDVENITKVSEALKSAVFSCADYKDIEPFYGEISAKNLIFLDPPYIPNSKTASFTDYSIDGFDSNKHKQLGMQLSKLLRNDTANVIFTNNYNDKSIELFVEKNLDNERFHAYKVNVFKTISAKNSGRGNTEELLISTFPIEHQDLNEL